MDRRDFLGGLLTMPALAGVECAEAVPAAPPKTWTFQAQIGHIAAATEALQPGEARQFLADTLREMATVLGQGHIGPVVPEPAWLTAAVDDTIQQAVRADRERRVRVLRYQLAQAEDALTHS